MPDIIKKLKIAPKLLMLMALLFSITTLTTAFAPQKAHAGIAPASVRNCLDYPYYRPTLRRLSPLAPAQCVKPLQWFLVILAGQNNLVPIDHIFGPKTEQAVKNFQTWVGLSPDGIVGPQTWAAIAAVCNASPTNWQACNEVVYP